MSGAPAGGVYIPNNLALYSYAHQKPVVANDPDGRFINNLIAGVYGAAESAVLQHVEISLGLRDEFSWTDMAVDAGVNAVTSGVGGRANTARRLAQIADASNDARRAGDDVAQSLVQRGDDVLGNGADLARRTCSFHGDTLVLTNTGLKPISNVDEGDLVWSRDATTGGMAWKPVLAQYVNIYDETVHVTVRDVDTGVEQVIISNRIHPFFVQIPAEQGEV